ncbi:MAG: leucine-rich repeat protein, partial [Lachnospira sp.]|nr:leucine-rich repeat protein [Lachnospira sp.]
SVDTIQAAVFQGCTSLKTVNIPDSVKTINRDAFDGCTSLVSVVIPKSVTEIDSYAFVGCTNLTKIIAYCDPSVIPEGGFTGCSENLEIVYANADGEISEDDASDDDVSGENTDDSKNQELDYESEPGTDGYESISDESELESEDTPDIVKVAANEVPQMSSTTQNVNLVVYTDLTPGEIYNFYIFKTDDVENAFVDGNLLHIEQFVADENGYVTVEYTLDEQYTDAVLRLVGKDKINIADVDMHKVTGWKYDGCESTPYIGMFFNGHKLVQGRDYHLSGDVVADGMGIYNITVSGDGAFTGEKSFRYIVTGDCVFGDGNGDNVVDIRDAVQLKQRIAGMDVDMNTYAADVNADTEIDIKDAVKLMKYMAGFEDVVLGEAS